MRGFSTRNDLERHLKSVHQILSESAQTHDKTYVCVADKCAKKGKVWPRADNFKQHCTRVHAKDGWDVDELMQRSVIADARNNPRCRKHFKSDTLVL